MNRLLFILMFIPFLSDGQTYKFFVQFTDKSQTPYSISNPSQFFSQRAILRREKQHIQITTQDLPVDPVYVNGVSAEGATILNRNKWFNGVTIECDSNTLSQILALPYVLSAQNVFRHVNTVSQKFFRFAGPVNTPLLPSSNMDYGEAFNQIHLMNGEFLHEQGGRGEGKLIAVLDAGFYKVDQLKAFDSLLANDQVIAVKDFVENDSVVFDAATHGMMVLSCIAGNVPGDILGTAPKASFLLLRSEDEQSENLIEEYNWNAAAEYADSAGADIISSSLGYTQFDNPLVNHTYADMDGDHCPVSIAADIAASKGILVINSAGNSGSSQWHYIGAPADGDSVLAVGAVDSLGHFASFSSYGPASDGAVKPNVAAKGELSAVADPFDLVSNANGTSFSCPILAGSAACLWQLFPDLSAYEIKHIIERSANYYSHPNDSLGYGIPDFRFAYNLLKHGTLPASDVLSINPTPFRSDLSINFFSTKEQNIDIAIYNAVGQIVYRNDFTAHANNYNDFYLTFGEQLNSGIFIARITTNENSYTKTLLKIE